MDNRNTPDKRKRVMNETYGVPTILTATPGHEIRRHRDWVEPHAEGDWDCPCAPAGDHDELHTPHHSG